MLLMGIKEYATSRRISDKLVRKLVTDGMVSSGKSGRKYLLVPEVVDEQIKKIFAVKPEQKTIPKIKKGGFHDALKTLRM